MEIYEIICGAIVLLLALLIIILCLMQDDKAQDSMTSALGGGINESFYGQNEGNTREAALAALGERIQGGAVLLNANMSREAIDKAITFTKENGAAAWSFFEATDCGAERRVFGEARDQGANAAYLASLGVKPYGGEESGAFAVFGGGSIAPNGRLVGYEGAEPRDAAILLAYQTPFETAGTFTKPDGSTVQTVPCL